MRVFISGSELGFGFVVGRRLVAAGHKVAILTSFEDLIPNLTKNKLNPVLGDVRDAEVQREAAKADAVIDVDTPFTFPRKRVHVSRLRPSLLRRALKGSGKTLIVTSHTAILGDTGPAPRCEDARLRPLPGFAWLPRFEKEILNSRGVRGVVIRPAWLKHGSKPSSLLLSTGAWIKLARRFRRGKFVGTGENCWSAVHVDDLADLYCVALEKATAGTILHAVSENISTQELVATIHRGYGFKGEPSGISLTDARRTLPSAERFTYSHALSGDRARALGWIPARESVLQEVERIARDAALVSRLRLPRTECNEK
jgi:nucleoside-diphosphate-sugar epimerase